MKVLITGATGLLGTHLVRRLLAEHYSVILLARNPIKAQKLFGSLVEAYPLEAVKSLTGIDAVVNLAGESIADGRWSTKKRLRITDSRVEGTRQLVNALCASGSPMPKVFVSASAVGIYGDAGEDVLTEESSIGRGFLAKVCQAWEEQARQIEDHGVRTVVLRIGMVLSKRGGALGKMLPFFQRGLGGPIGNGKQWVSWIHMDDLVALIIRGLQDTTLSGVYNAVSPQPIRNADFSAVCSELLEKRNSLRVPSFVLRLALGEMATVLLDSQRAVPRRLQNTGFTFRYSEIKNALRAELNDTEIQLA